MLITSEIEIAKSAEVVWQVITDIENCEERISNILKINVLNKPTNGLIGLKWEETREMFGKESIETMWITAAQNNIFYQTRAESHGAVYISKLSLTQRGNNTLLSMSFTAKPQTTLAKMLSFIMAPLINKSIVKGIDNDLQDIKFYAETN